MQRARELKNARYRLNQVYRDLEIRRKEMELLDELEALESSCLKELRNLPEDADVLTVNEVVRNYRRNKSELRAR